IVEATKIETKYLSCAETAKLLRTALKKAFPGTKFSVRSDVYAGGASIDVSWVLGPTTKEVDAIGGQFASADFDGSIDLQTHWDHWLLPDGSTIVKHGPGTEGSMGYIPAITNPMPEGAVPVSFGSHYVQCARRYAEHWEGEMPLKQQVARDMCVLQHIAYTGDWTIGLFGANDTEQVDQHAWRLLNITSFKPDEEYSGVRYATEEERNSEGWDGQQVFVILKKQVVIAGKH
ncbi:MAG: LPD29 domain-containing protein, partial [Chloroflexota bacterium]